jgi:hypothetical protein
MKTLLCHIALFVVLALNSLGQQRSLRVSADREEIRIGEQINLQITLTSAAADTVRFPIVLDTLRKEVEVLSKSAIDTTFEGDQLGLRVLRQSLLITSFDSGYFPVKPLTALINNDSVASNAFLVSVQTMPIDTAKGIVDIKDIEEIPFSWKEWFQENGKWLVLALLMAALIFLFARYLLRKKPIDTSPIVFQAPRPAHEVALERIEALRARELWQKDEYKLFYSELTDILRWYLEQRFDVRAMEQTTSEIMGSLAHLPDFNDEDRTKLKRLLFLADLVKFAKERPIGHENDVHLTAVESFIKSHTPINPPHHG